jgi:mannose-6-phosphate isomerase-like protein (cupin superfamily)
MDIANIHRTTEWFEVLQTHQRSQTAMMTLEPGKATGARAEAHEKSEQVLLLLKGELHGELDGQDCDLKQGEVVVIPAGTKHRFVNNGQQAAVTFNVYAPPAYPAGTKG